MNSSMLAGEQRWASARRGGMKVLGKVAVPKPLNLPSQRLENHGLDPNFEIVPKGTLSWGSRASSSGSNAWLSSAPNTDGGNTAHSHVSGRPSSGGSGTRPSTSESDRTNVPVANAWGSNSRPSTASGSLTSNQTSLRPKSAETRPRSSQVSRFSEPVSESSTAWGASGVGERLGVKSYKEDGFSLSSGDFPTLGSEKENSVMNAKSQENCRPSSASERTAWAKEEDAKFHADGQRGTMNTLRADGPRTAEDGILPRMENWQGDPQQYFNTNIPSQHFDAWHSPPFNGPAGPWYRGCPPGPAFGGHVAPGGFPMEPFPYYPHISHPAVGRAQSVPPAGSGPRGTHLRNGDFFRPPIPDAYARPGIPFRPGFYQGHPVPPGQMTFEGYYGPPRGYCSNEREIPFMTARPPSYNGFQALSTHDPNFPGGSIGHGPSGKTLPIQMEADRQSQQRVSSKNHNDWYQKDEEETWDRDRDRDIHPNVLYSGKGSLPTMTSQNNERGAEENVENDKYANRTVPSDYSARSYERQGHSSGSVRVRSIESMGSTKLVNDNLTNELPNVASFPTEGCQIPFANERNPSLQGETKDSVLMQKLEVLNAKFRVSSDGLSDAPNAFNREECRSRFQVEKKMNNCSVEGTNAGGSFEKVPTSVDFGSALHQVTVPKQSTSAVSRSSYHGGHGRVNRVRDDAGKTAEDSMIDSARKIEVEPAEETSDPSDIPDQRARRRELAKQRVLQLHKEEEERTREQKAKAFAKLEELDRRTQVGETANKKETAESFGDIYGEQEKLCTLGGTVLVDPKFQAPCQNLVSDSNVTSMESSISQSGESVEVTKNLPVEPPQQLEPNLSHGQSLHMKDPRNARKVGMQLNDGGISKHNRTGYKQKQNKSLVKSSHEKSVANIALEAPEEPVSIPTNFTSTEASSSEIQSGDESNVLNTSKTVAEPSSQQRRKNDSSRNKHKLYEAPVFPVLSSVLSDSNPGKPVVEDVESKDSWSNLDGSAVTVADHDIEVKAAKSFSSLPNEGHNRVANQLKRQPFRRTLRSQLPNKFMDVHHSSDTIIWAPVRTQNKSESGIEVDKKSILEVDNALNSDNMAQINSKGKRAEMERYVPKPVAMELAQQGNTPPMPSPINMLKSDEVPGILQFGSFSSVSPQPVGSVTVFVASKIEAKEVEDKHKIHKKEHGTWRQRGSTDSSHMKGVNLGPALISEPSKDVPKSTEQHQFINSATNSANADTSDSHNISDNTTTAAMSKIPAVKDHGPTVRGKRNLPWVPRSTGNNPDHGDILCNEVDGSGTLSAADVDRPDRTIVSKDSRSRGDQPLSHWKPKLNSKFANNLHGNKTTGIENVTIEITRASKKDHPSQKTVQVLPQNDKRSRNSYRCQPGQSVSESNVVEESVAGNQQEFDREKKPSSAKEPPFSLNQDPINSTESVPSANTDIKHEHDISTGSRRIGKQNSRTMRDHESRGDWASSQENRPTHAHRFRERHWRSANYEYQPVGPHKSSGPEKLDGPADGASNVRLINQERGQNHPKR